LKEEEIKNWHRELLCVLEFARQRLHELSGGYAYGWHNLEICQKKALFYLDLEKNVENLIRNIEEVLSEYLVDYKIILKAITSDIEKEKKCPNCRKILKKDVNFCPICGCRIT